MNLFYNSMKVISRFSSNRHEFISNYFRKKGIKIGDNCNITSNISTAEPYLLCIGNNVTISTDVLFITHDASVGKIFGKEVGSDLFGEILIGDNCFIGARSTILYGVTLANNIIVASGSVVTKSFTQEKIIIGGNPAKMIGDWSDFEEKINKKVFNVHGKKGKQLELILMHNKDKFILK